MLTHLHISHYALIESLDIDLRSGYTVITGETGAGKSILLGALSLLLGGRADARVVKQGEQKCVVEATFSLEGIDLTSFFEENDMDYDTAECVVRRELTAAGKSRAFVNDTPVLLSVLKPLGAQLVDIHSQHQNQLLGSEEFLLQTLDLVAANDQERGAYAQAYETYRAAQQALSALKSQAERDAKEQEFLRYQLQQLSEFQPQVDEQESLEEEQILLSHAEEIKSGLYQAVQLLSGEELDVLQQLRQSMLALSGVGEHLPQATELVERLESARIELGDIIDELEQQQERVEFNPQRLEYVDDRLSQLYHLLERFGVENEAALCGQLVELQQRLDAIENMDEEVVRLTREQEQAYAALLQAAQMLTATRQKAATTVAADLTERIAQLGMPNGCVEFSLSARLEPQADGTDTLQLMFSANKNVSPQNVQDIASGGEVARLMLSLKSYTARYRQLPTIIFDEIDTGVSGTMAECMGQVMQELSHYCQVLCITHLPQIAALGDEHFRVYKEEDAEGTHSHIVPLSQEERIAEIANMLSGSEMTEAAINNAKSLLGL
ncbi:MAG: DNA repair protein RecN [Bacteroidaceae bacterium]|nr:DNA repair protein RecN [Bacteroidaceae bacterium]